MPLTHSLTLGWPPHLPVSLGFPRSRLNSAAGCLAVEIPHLLPIPRTCSASAPRDPVGSAAGQPHMLSLADLAPWRAAHVLTLQNPGSPRDEQALTAPEEEPGCKHWTLCNGWEQASARLLVFIYLWR